jgi:cytochrome c oxidase subunit 4
MATHNESVREELRTHEPGVGRYVLVWIILLICTFGTFAVSKIPMSPNGHLLAAIAISVVKATLVILIFMHLWEAEGANRLVFVTSILFVAVMFFFILTDTAHRFPLANSRLETTVNLPEGNPIHENRPNEMGNTGGPAGQPSHE